MKIDDIVQDGINGFVIGNGGRTFVEVFCKLADAILKQEPYIENFQKQAQERVKNFSLGRYTNELDKLFEDKFEWAR